MTEPVRGYNVEMIPPHVIDFAKAFVALANQHNLEKGVVTCRMEGRHDQEVSIVWEQGRHGEDGHKFTIRTTASMWGEYRIQHNQEGTTYK